MSVQKFKADPIKFMKNNPVFPSGGIRPAWRPRHWTTVELPVASRATNINLKYQQSVNPTGGRASYEAKAPGTLRCCFLPWLDRCISYTTMPMATAYFFTSAINGCSVFITGDDPQRPVVWHAGVDGQLTNTNYRYTGPIS